MADKERAFAHLVNGEGASVPVPLDKLLDIAAEESTAALEEIVESSYTISDYFGGWLFAVDVDPKTTVGYAPVIPISDGYCTGLRAGRYLVLYGFAMEKSDSQKEEAQAIDGIAHGGLLLATSAEQIEGESIEAVEVSISPRDEGEELPGDAAFESLSLYLIKRAKTGSFAVISDLILGLGIVALTEIFARRYYANDSNDRLEQIAEDILERVREKNPENSPLMVRNGKLFTDAMRGKPKREDILLTGAGVITGLGTLSISADTEKELLTAIGGSKTLIQLNDIATASGYRYEPDKPCRIETTLDELIEDRREDTRNKKTRAKITRELKAISSISWSFNNDRGEFVRIPLAGGMCSVRRGVVSFVFSAEYMGAVLDRAAGRMPLDRRLLTTDEKNHPNSTPIGFKLSTHTYQNKGKANENTLSVSRLLEYVNGIPSYEEVSRGNRNYTDRIIKPLERDLNHLIEIGLLDWWEYCHENGKPLTDAEQDARFDVEGNDAALPYSIAISCNVQWQLAEEHPEQMAETMAARERKRLDAEAAKQRNEERDRRIARKKESYIAKAAAKEEMNKR